MPITIRAFIKQPRLLQQDCGVAVRYQRRLLLDKKMPTTDYCYSEKNVYWDFPFECFPAVFPLVNQMFVFFPLTL